MKTFRSLLLALGLLLPSLLPWFMPKVQAIGLTSENFSGSQTVANAWINGGSGGSVACLTAGSSSTPGTSIPGCSASAIDSPGSGFLRLTPTANTRSGFVIYNTPVTSAQGLEVKFDMYQYGGTGADGISFFLIDGSASPTVPGAAGGSLGYSRNSDNSVPGLVGGYIGVGFDRFGNFSNPAFGSGGPGAIANRIAVRGSQATDYQYITGAAADTSLSGSTRINSKLKVKINISTTNVMSVAVDYGSGYVTELANIDLEAVNGVGSLPANFKFGFAASTGGSTNTHEIGGLTVNTNPPNVGINLSHSGNFTQGETGQFNMTVTNSPGAEPTTGTISVSQTLPAGLTPTSASGTGWTCSVSGQTVSCSRPGSGGSALAAGATAPSITVAVAVADNATTPLVSNASVVTANNANPTPSDSDSVVVQTGSWQDDDGVFNVVEAAAPNSGDANGDGVADSTQDNVTSLPNPVTGAYTSLQTSCDANSAVSVSPESSNSVADADYSYPTGLVNFTATCLAGPGATATITQYHYGSFDAAKMVARKYDTVHHTYADLPTATLATVTIAGRPVLRLQYQITDGSAWDADGLANGVIVDPTGPALQNTSLAAPAVATPNTGLPAQPLVWHLLACLTGTGLIGYEIVKLVATKRATYSTTGQ